MWRSRCALKDVFPPQGSAGLHHPSSEDNRLPADGDGVHTLAVCPGQPELLLPHAGSHRGLPAHAGTWLHLHHVGKKEVEIRQQASLSSPLFQDYVRKLVSPLFQHFKNITSDWSQVPDRLTDQWAHSAASNTTCVKQLLFSILRFCCRYNQVNAIRMACSAGVSGCRELTTTWFREWMDHPQNNLLVSFVCDLFVPISFQPVTQAHMSCQDPYPPALSRVLQRCGSRGWGWVGVWLVSG